MGRRNSKGSALAEFGPAMAVFVCFIMAPLIDVSFIPVRYFIAQGAVAETAHRLSMAEKRSDAQAVAAENWWVDFAGKCGVQLHPHAVDLVICGKNSSDQLVVAAGQPVPTQWLPNGSKGPCVYAMELTADADIPPLFNGAVGLPGFTAPLHMKLHGRSNWENVSRDPSTHQFYINE